jgi:group I intron endonuclease
MPISRALLKYGYSNFKLEILEYCEPSNCLEREQYYLDSLNPEYNILKIAGSCLGHRWKLSKTRLGRKQTEETKQKISSSFSHPPPHTCVGWFESLK